MGKLNKAVKESPLAKSAFLRRKMYDTKWQAVHGSAKKSTRNQKKPWTVKKSALAEITNAFVRARPRISRKEMEELGCEPLGILTKHPGQRDSGLRSLSFTSGTVLNEKTPKRGTPLTQRCVVEMGRNKVKEIEELEETVSKIRRAVHKGAMSVDEALTDIDGLKLRRRSAEASCVKFHHLEMKLRRENGQNLEAGLACIRALFAATDKKTISKLHKELEAIVKAAETNATATADVSVISDCEDDESEDEKIPIEQQDDSPKKYRSPMVTSSTHTTPDSIDQTPSIKSGSAVKTRLRFTPLLSSAMRQSLTNVPSSKKKRASFKLTPLRRSTRVTRSSVSNRGFRAVDMTVD